MTPHTPMTAEELVKVSLMHPRFVRELRDDRIRAMRAEGRTFREIGDAFNLSRARIEQICAGHNKEAS